jgi:hypothetical protein
MVGSEEENMPQNIIPTHISIHTLEYMPITRKKVPMIRDKIVASDETLLPFKSLKETRVKMPMKQPI